VHHWTKQWAARQGLLSAGDDVAERPSLLLEAEDLLSARQDRLPGRKLEPTAAAVGAELVGDVQAGGANAEAGDRGSLGHDPGDRVLVEGAA
jgi:hypothetical protein